MELYHPPLKFPHNVCLSITPTSFAVEPYVLHVGMYLYLTSYTHHSCRSVVCVCVYVLYSFSHHHQAVPNLITSI